MRFSRTCAATTFLTQRDLPPHHRQARSFGFDGKTLIHPSQIAACNLAFAPAPDEVEAARKIIAAFERPE